MLIRLLGGVDVAGEDDRRRPVPGKRGCVLAALAVTPGEAVSTEELVRRVWGSSLPEAAFGAMYAHITRLRSTLSTSGVAIARAGGGYVLDIEPGEVDLLTVRRLAARAREDAAAGEYSSAVGRWRRATGLLRGEALAGVDGEWANRFRQTFGGEARSMLAERYGWELRWGRHLAVVDELLETVARYPTSEALAEHLMLALYRSGRQAESLEVFDRTVSVLRDRLGVDPSESMRRLHRRILNQDAALAAPAELELPDVPPATVSRPDDDTAPAQLPAAPRGFVGRDTESESLRRATDHSSVLVVDGMPGVGKTAIAVHTATELTDRFPDGQLFIDLHGFSGDVPAVTPEDALERMLRALGAGDDIPAGLDERSAELRTRLAGRRTLILLDNAASSAQVRPLLPGSRDCLTIITSRRRMPDLLEATPISLDVMEPDAAARLLVAAVGDPRRVAADSSDVADLVELAGRLPLALRLIAARLRNRAHWTTGYLLWRLRQRPVLEELSAQDEAVAAAFTVSYTELDEEHRRMFRLLGLYPGQDFDTVMAAALAGVEPGHADRSLEALVDSHLLQSTEPGRYHFHDLMRHHAAAMAAETDSTAEIEAARLRLYDTAVALLRHATALYDTHVGYYPRLVDTGEATESPWRTRLEATVWLRTEQSNLTAMMSAANGQRMDLHCAEMTAAMSAFYSHYNVDRELDRIAEWGLDSARRVSHQECESYFLNKLAGMHQACGDVELAERLHKQALAIGRRLGDARHIVGSLTNLALVYGRAGAYDRAVELRGEAVELAAANGLTALEARVRTFLGGSLCSCGRLDEARSQLEHAQRLVTGSGDTLVEFQLIAHWGVLRRHEGCPDEAHRLHERALAMFRSECHWVGEVQMHTEIAEDLIARQRWDDAWKSCVAAMETLGDNERPELRAEVLLVLAEVCLARGDYEDAVEQLRAVEGIGRNRNAAAFVARAEWGLARAARALGDEDDAGRYAASALVYYERQSMPQAEGVHRFLAEE